MLFRSPFMKRWTAALLVLLLCLASFTGCNLPKQTTAGQTTPPVTTPSVTTPPATTPPATTPPVTTTPPATTTADSEGEEAEVDFWLNDAPLSDFTIVYSGTDPDYTLRAAKYLQQEIEARTGLRLTVESDQNATAALPHEIVVGETNRQISLDLDAKTEGFTFSLMANDDHVALEGDYFLIAAAAYYFVESYILAEPFSAEPPKVETVCTPIVREAKNYFVLIGDGMGFNQTRLFDVYSAVEMKRYSDGESAFYGYSFPYQGRAKTDSLSGTTDSAASGTALATGYKTINGYIGKDKNKNDVPSLTEMAIALGMATAVMSTETITGATPAAFSAHANNRNDSDDISADQSAMSSKYGTYFLGSYGANYGKVNIVDQVERDLWSVLDDLSEDEDGFFMMIEEAFIDKHSHSNELLNTFFATIRFNQIIGCVMEYAFYHPETFVLITADHETGGLTKAEDGSYYYTTGDHTSADVPIFAYGVGAEVFDGVTIENIQIPKTIAAMWGIDLEGYNDAEYPSLIPVGVDAGS